MEELKPKYNLLTAICLVVGIVVGTGIFFKASGVLAEVNGNLTLATLAWIIGGFVMLISSFNFANFSLKYGDIHSMPDFARVTVSNNYGFLVGVFVKYIYFPAMTATISFVVGMYFCEACGLTGGSFPFNFYVFLFAFIFLFLLSLTSLLAPYIASKIQVSTTVIKLIPLLLMGIGGLIIGLVRGTLTENFSYTTPTNTGKGFLAAICVTCFSYEGWICATNIGAEIKNRKKNLPIALLIGTTIVMIIYILYNLGISGAIGTEELLGLSSDSERVKVAFANLFGNTFSQILIFVVVISAIGTLNGIVMANSRAAYALAINRHGIFQDKMTTLTKKTNVPLISSIMGFILAVLWLAYYYLSQTNSLSNGIGFPFDSSELPIITAYTLYIPMYISFMIKNKDLNIFKRFVLPILGIIAALVMIVASIYRHQINVLYYLIFFTFVIGLAYLVVYLAKRRREKAVKKNIK